ncbi:MAG: tetratricopeptide repeat protein [Thermoplasmata archaeon]
MPKEFTTKDRVLVHLLEYFPEKDKYPQPVEITQEGMAESIGAKQNTISYAVRDLVKRKMVYEKTTRIEGKRQRRKGYFLTERGIKKAEEVKDKVFQKNVKLEVDGEVKEIHLKELNRFLHTNFTIIEILNKLEGDKFEYHSGSFRKKNVTYYRDLPQGHVDTEKAEDVKKWLEDGENNILLVEGEYGTGKTNLVTSIVNECEENVNIFYMKLEIWHTLRNLWDNIANFLSKCGEHKLTSYLEVSEKTNFMEVVINLEMDLKLIPKTLFIIEDLDENNQISKELCDLVKNVGDLDNLTFIFTGAPGFCRVDKKEAELKVDKITLDFEECERPMFVKLAEDYFLKETCEAVLDIVIETKFTPEEYLALAYISIHRIPVEKNEITNLEPVNKHFLNNIINTALVKLTTEEKPLIHPFARRRIIGRMPEEMQRTLYNFAADYYEELPAKTEIEKVEYLYHLGNSGDIERFTDGLWEYGPDITSSGYSDSLLRIIYDTKFQLSQNDSSISFWEAECDSIQENYNDALELYDKAIDNTDEDWIITKSRHGKAKLYRELGDVNKALTEYKQSLKNAERLREERKDLLGITYLRLGEILDIKGEYDKAQKYLENSVEILKKKKMYSYLTTAYFHLARIWKNKGDLNKALDYFKDGSQMWENIDETYKRVGGLHEMGMFYKVIRDLEHAEEFIKETVSICEQLGYEKLKGSALITLAECYLEKGEHEKVVGCAKDAEEIFDFFGNEEDRAYAFALMGQAYSKLDEEKLAEENLSRAISIYQKLGSSYSLGLAYFSMAKLQEKKGNKEGVADNFRKSLLSLSCSGANNVVEQVEREMKTIPLSM